MKELKLCKRNSQKFAFRCFVLTDGKIFCELADPDADPDPVFQIRGNFTRNADIRVYDDEKLQ